MHRELSGRETNIQSSCVTITHDALRTVRNMKNPFQYGGIVEGPAFCNRKKELADLTAAIENSDKLFLYSERPGQDVARAYGPSSAAQSTLCRSLCRFVANRWRSVLPLPQPGRSRNP